MMGAARTRRKREESLEKTRFYNTLNAFGLVMRGRDWHWQSPKGEGVHNKPALLQRIEKAEREHQEYVEKRQREKDAIRSR